MKEWDLNLDNHEVVPLDGHSRSSWLSYLKRIFMFFLRRRNRPSSRHSLPWSLRTLNLCCPHLNSLIYVLKVLSKESKGFEFELL